MAIRAEVVAIGDELTCGHRLDTNSQFLSRQLGLLGIPVTHHTTVGDDQNAIAAVLAAACGRSQVVVISGGLGPTADDVTRQALAQMAGRPLVRDEPSLRHIRALFERRGRTMPERNTIQAYLPEGSRALGNPHGTAPGIHLTIPRASGLAVDLFALPGVPAELTDMWHNAVCPALVARLGPARRVIQQRSIRCFGAGESEVESLLPDLVRRGRDPLVGITASHATITLRVVAEGSSAAECEAKMAPTVAIIYDCLGTLIYGEGDTELQDAVIELLAAGGHTLATVEWGTAGLLADWLGSASVGSPCYRGGLVVGDFPTLPRLLGLDVNTEHDPSGDQRPLVGRMARAAREKYGTSHGLAIGPFPTEGDPAGASAVHVAVAGPGPEQLVSESFGFAAHPAIQRSRCAKQALNLLRLSMLERRV